MGLIEIGGQQPESIEQLKERILGLLDSKFNINLHSFVGTAYLPREYLDPNEINHLTVKMTPQQGIELFHRKHYDPFGNITRSDRYQVERDVLTRSVVFRVDGTSAYLYSIDVLRRWDRIRNEWEIYDGKQGPIEDEYRQRRFLEDLENFLKNLKSFHIAVTPHSP